MCKCVNPIDQSSVNTVNTFPSSLMRPIECVHSFPSNSRVFFPYEMQFAVNCSLVKLVSRKKPEPFAGIQETRCIRGQITL